MATATVPAATSERVYVIPAGALPVIKAFLDDLGVMEIIDALVPNEAGEYPSGAVAGVVIASRLQGVPLPSYEMTDWARGNAVPALFGVPAEKLNDDRLGAMLDALRPHRVAIWGWVMNRAVQRLGVDLRTLHADPTKIAFEGSYAGQEALPPEVPRITYGKPKDGQVDRKLLTWSTLVSDDGGVPAWFGLTAGNHADDLTYLEALRAHLPLEEVLVMTGDSKLPSRGNLLGLCRWHYHFVAPEPWHAARRERLEKLWRQGATWEPVAQVAEADRHKPEAERGQYSVIRDTDALTDPLDSARYPLRRLYVRSSRKAEHPRLKREKQLAMIQTALERIQGLLNKQDYTPLDLVRQRVARVRRQNPAGRYFQVQVTKTRAHTAPLRLTWTVQRKALRADARWDGVYSVITNLPAETHSPTAVLEIYKDQHQAEGRFRDLNQLPVRVRPLWLKRPDRIEARVFLVMLAALIFALLERQGRRYLAQTGQVIEGLMPEKRDTPTPKGQRLLRALATVSLVQIEEGLRVRLLLSELSPIQRHILQALGLTDLHRSLTGLVQQGGMVSASVPA